MKLANLVESRKYLAQRITNPLVKILSKSGITPNVLTFVGLALNVAAAYLIAVGHFFFGGVLVLVSGLFDLLDGALARFNNQATQFGAILDSTIDRVSEAAIFCGLLIWYMPKGVALEIVLILAVLIGSFLVSYIRARAEGLGLECKVGLFTRAERVIALAAGLLLNQMFVALCVLAIFIYITVIQRLVYVKKQTKKGES
ncbi:MAG: CDP-alcohol phosphatidyltransferase family protein [Chloroflexota bacterium]|nr:CDP-alcohol phosphatidyltransferase family protein [Chloroflexota bacterium]